LTTPAGFEELHQLAGQAARFATIFSVDPDEASTFEGHDETQLVHTEVNAAGQVVDVRLERDWDKTIDARRLGAAVIEAVNAATVSRVSTWADRVAEVADEPAEPVPVRAPEPITINPSGAMVDDLLYLLHRVGQETKPPERARRRDYDDDDEPTPARKRLTKGRSEGGHIVVALDGTTVADVQVETDTRWVGSANHLEVASELSSAFEAAYRRADEEEPKPRGTSAVAELQALTADPQEFVARLFGLDR
jgi:DNA-binding protein YbaB